MNDELMTPIQIEPFKIYKHNAANNIIKKTGLTVLSVGLFMFLVSLTGISNSNPIVFFFLSFGLVIAGTLVYITMQVKEAPAGIKNNKLFLNSFMSKGTPAWILGVIITAFYIVLYWFPALIENWVKLVNPLSYWLKDKPADRWFLYGTFYTAAVLVMGVRMIVKYRHNRYQIIRTISVSFFQFAFAFLIPALLVRLNQPEHYFTYFWPLKYQYLFPGDVNCLTQHNGALGYFIVFWGIIMIAIATPVLTYFFGKRWYCSWVCGCGGLAETAGDPFRQNSDKSLNAWKV